MQSDTQSYNTFTPRHDFHTHGTSRENAKKSLQIHLESLRTINQIEKVIAIHNTDDPHSVKRFGKHAHNSRVRVTGQGPYR